MNAHTLNWRTRPQLESLTDRLVPTVNHLFAVGADIGGGPVVQVYREDGTLDFTIRPFPDGFTGGVRVATGDVNGDGTDDIVVGAGPGGGPEVKIYDGTTGTVIRDFYAYSDAFRGGVNVAVGDVNGDGKADGVVGVGVGGGPNVRVFDGATGTMTESFFAYESSFTGGVNVAAGDVNGDGLADIITGVGVGGGPRVRVFDSASGQVIGNFFAYGSDLRSGVTVAAGDVNGDGRAEIITGVGEGGGPNVKVFDGQSDAQLTSFFAYGSAFTGGVAVGVAHFNGAIDILTTPGPSAGGYGEVFDQSGTLVSLFRPFPTFHGGITTGQGAATTTAPFSDTFASVAPFPRSAGTPYIAGSNDTTGNGVDSPGDVLGGNDGSSWTPPPPGI